MLAIVSFPTGAEIREAAAGGDEKARADLEGLKDRERFLERYQAMELKQAAQLPDLEGDALHFEWTVESSGGERHVVIRLRPSGSEVWREIEAWENWEHFLDVRGLLRARYGSRYRGLDIHDHAWLYLLGDRLLAADRLDAALAEDAQLRLRV
jgi:hypothetical protein